MTTIQHSAITSSIPRSSGGHQSQQPDMPVGGGNAGKSTADKKPPASIRVDLERIDRLVNMVGELVITQAMLSEQIG